MQLFLLKLVVHPYSQQISLVFPSNSKADASEFQGNIEEMHVVNKLPCLYPTDHFFAFPCSFQT